MVFDFVGHTKFPHSWLKSPGLRNIKYFGRNANSPTSAVANLISAELPLPALLAALTLNVYDEHGSRLVIITVVSDVIPSATKPEVTGSITKYLYWISPPLFPHGNSFHEIVMLSVVDSISARLVGAADGAENNRNKF